MKKIIFLSMLYVICIQAQSQTKKTHNLKFSNIEDTKNYFHYTGMGAPIISGHRGGTLENFPENSIATFQYVLEATPAIFEIDPRMTKDGQVVLMHDADLDRTTTGKGQLKDYTLRKVRKLKLKDSKGQITDLSIPTLEEAIKWSKGKTVLNLDIKDVPLQTKADMVKKYNAFHHVIFTVHSAEEAKFFYDFDHSSMFSAFVKTNEAFSSYEKAGIPWENVLMAYVGPWSIPENQELYDRLHKEGVMVMVSAASSYDKLKDPVERAEAYRKVIEDGADILESDRPIEVYNALKGLLNRDPKTNH